MRSITALRKMIPMPSHCPICGRSLTKEDSAIDHILPPYMGGKDEPDNIRYLCRACNAWRADRYDPLFEYYYRLMKSKGVSDKNLAEKINLALNSLSESDLESLKKRVEASDPIYRKILAYKNVSERLKDEDSNDFQPSNDELAGTMIRTIRAYVIPDLMEQ